MHYIPFLLCVLACPIGMGLMLWMAMRPDKKQASYDGCLEAGVAARSSRSSGPSQVFSPVKMMVECVKMCLNWRVLGVLALVALVIAIVAPQWLWGAIPLLLAVACPVSMLVMLFSMHASRRSQRPRAEMPDCASCEVQQSSFTRMEQSVTQEQGSEEPTILGVPTRNTSSRSLTSFSTRRSG